jgi:hypothetical protein
MMLPGCVLPTSGCFQAIRNPAYHMTGDWNPVVAFEHLAALSVVARWVSEWDLVRYGLPEPQVELSRVADVWLAQQGSRQVSTAWGTSAR